MACTGGDGSQGQRKRPAQASLAGLWGKKVSNPQKDLRDAKMKVMQAKVFGQVEPGAFFGSPASTLSPAPAQGGRFQSGFALKPARRLAVQEEVDAKANWWSARTGSGYATRPLPNSYSIIRRHIILPVLARSADPDKQKSLKRSFEDFGGSAQRAADAVLNKVARRLRRVWHFQEKKVLVTAVKESGGTQTAFIEHLAGLTDPIIVSSSCLSRWCQQDAAGELEAPTN